MSNRLTLRISVILLAIGIGLVPTAYLISGYIQDQVNAEIPRTFSIIRQGFANYLEVNFIGLGIPEITDKMRSPLTKIPSLEDVTIHDYLYLLDTIPHFLPLIKTSMLNKFPSMINGSKTAQFINETITAVMNETALSEGEVRDLFFNDYQFENNYDNATIQGISEYGLGTASLNFTRLTLNKTLDGYLNYPGLLQDLSFGSGVLSWLEFYNLAKMNIDNNRTAMETAYNCTWSSGQLQNISYFIKNYMWDTVVKSTYFPKTIETYALETFYGQWANYSFYDNYVNLRAFIDPLATTLRGFEVVRPTASPSSISLTTCESLWDESNPFSFANQSGLIKWLRASNSSFSYYNEALELLNSTYGLTLTQFQSITTWLFDTENDNNLRAFIINNLVPLPKPFGFATSPVAYRDDVFYAQWANGTVVEDGVNLNLAGNLKGFEVGVPISTNISRSIANSFFNVNNVSSFMSQSGIFMWVKAEQGNITIQNELMNIFALSSSQLSILLNWLFNIFKKDIVPFLVLPLIGETLNQLASDEFPKQWTYGTYSKESIDLTNYSSSGFSYLGWELGITTDLNLNITQITDLSKSRQFPTEYPPLGLLDSSNSMSFTNRKGISKWVESKEIPEYYNEIIDAFSNRFFSLTNTEYTEMYNYIIFVKENYVIPLLTQESPFKIEPYTLSQMYQTGILIGAIVIIAAGVVFGVFDFLRKKR